MTLQLRPTFSESWYRVVNLRPRLRPGAQITRQYYRGERWYVVRDPAGNQFHRLSDAAYRFVGLLDGTRTVGDAWELVGGTLADDAPTQPEVIQILNQLYAANLIETDVPPDAQVLLRRHKKQMQRKMQGRLMNVIFPRFPFWDPDRFLVRWLPVVGKFISPVGWIVWLAVVVTALALVLPEWQRLRESAADAMAPGNWLWLWVVFVVTKFIHELGHAFACRRFGGEVHEMGVMFLVFIPTPYVDASTAWGFANKWKRLFVGAAGMWIELFVASLCALAWLATGQGTLLNQLLYNAMLVASISTVLFNANPLLRYDGYYMLSDYLEMPNLQMRSRDYNLGLIKRHVFRVKATQPLPPPAQRGILFTYGVLSTAYRLFIGFAIMIMVLYQLPEEVKILGLLMGAGALATWLVVPLVKAVKYLALDPELHRKRSRAWAWSLAATAVVLILVGLIRFDVDVYAEGVIEAQQKVVLFGKSEGFIREIRAQDGQMLKTGDVILVAYDAGLESALKQTQARLAALEMRQRLSRAKAESYAQSMIDQGEIDATREHLAELQRQWDELTIRAPIDGQLIMPGIEQTQGRYLQRGQELGKVLSTGMMKVRATLDQRDAQLATNAPDSARAEVRLSSKPDDTLYAQGFTLTPAAQERLPSVALGHAGGGAYAIDPQDPKGTRPIERQFELLVRLSAADGQLEFYPGQRAYVRLKLDRQTLAWQGMRRLMQLIQTTSNAKALS